MYSDSERRRRDSEQHGYEPPSGQAISVHMCRVQRLVHTGVLEALGRVGLNALGPEFFDELTALVEEACMDSHHEAWQDSVIQAGRESDKRSNTMVGAMLTSGLRGDSEEMMLAKGLGAGLCVDAETIEEGFGVQTAREGGPHAAAE